MDKTDVITVEGPVKLEDPSPRLQRVVKAHARCNAAEAAFAEHWARGGNKAKAYRLAMNYPHDVIPSQRHYMRAVEYSNMPNVLEYFDALRGLAAENAGVDIQRLLERDARVVAADDANAHAELTRYVWLNCRHCHGVGGEYQWIDVKEYQDAMATWFDSQARVDQQGNVIDNKPMPVDVGGYGFDAWTQPNESCRKCMGLGEQKALVADTTKLEGGAAILYKGIKQTNSGIEVLTQDVEKARDRLYKAVGAFKDSPADIARGAAAGAAAGAAYAQSAARSAVVAESMTDEQAARMYLELAG